MSVSEGQNEYTLKSNNGLPIEMALRRFSNKLIVYTLQHKRKDIWKRQPYKTGTHTRTPGTIGLALTEGQIVLPKLCAFCDNLQRGGNYVLFLFPLKTLGAHKTPVFLVDQFTFLCSFISISRCV